MRLRSHRGQYAISSFTFMLRKYEHADTQYHAIACLQQAQAHANVLLVCPKASLSSKREQQHRHQTSTWLHEAT